MACLLKKVDLSVRRQLPVSFNDNYVFPVPFPSPVRILLAPMGAAEKCVSLQAYAACQAYVVSGGEALLAG